MKEGFVFVEWQLNGDPFNFNSPITENITLVAVWKQKDIEDEPVEFEEVTFEHALRAISNVNRRVISNDKYELIFTNNNPYGYHELPRMVDAKLDFNDNYNDRIGYIHIDQGEEESITYVINGISYLNYVDTDYKELIPDIITDELQRAKYNIANFGETINLVVDDLFELILFENINSFNPKDLKVFNKANNYIFNIKYNKLIMVGLYEVNNLEIEIHTSNNDINHIEFNGLIGENDFKLHLIGSLSY